MRIGEFEIGKDGVFIIAELSANHGGSIDLAVDTIRAAKSAGADAIKLQTYTPDTITIDVKKDDFKISHGTLWDEKYLHALYHEAYTPWEWHEKLFEVAKEEGLICFSSPFDHTAVDFLEGFHVPAYKIASFEITDIPLIRKVAALGKPIIISTGIATLEDIELAIDTCHKAGNRDIVLLKCTSSYPAPIEEANLSMIADFQRRFGVVPGLSDHTLGITVPTVSVALGAQVIEKHFILDKSIGGPDADFSLDLNEFKQMVTAVREAQEAVGEINYEVNPRKEKSRIFSRSLYVVKDIAAGETITEENVRSIRPGYGAHPKHLDEAIGKKALKAMERGDRFLMENIDA